jgi:hypothetical protein
MHEPSSKVQQRGRLLFCWLECALKSAIARKTQRYDFPPEPKVVTKQTYVHNLDTLLKAAGLGTMLDAAVANDPVLGANWALVKDWDNESRYVASGQVSAKKHSVVSNVHVSPRDLRRLWPT